MCSFRRILNKIIGGIPVERITELEEYPQNLDQDVFYFFKSETLKHNNR